MIFFHYLLITFIARTMKQCIRLFAFRNHFLSPCIAPYSTTLRPSSCAPVHALQFSVHAPPFLPPVPSLCAPVSQTRSQSMHPSSQTMLRSSQSMHPSSQHMRFRYFAFPAGLLEVITYSGDHI